MTSPTHLLTVLTPDKRGIIASLTELLAASKIDLLELSQTVVRDYFTIIMVVKLPKKIKADNVVTEIEQQLSGAAASLVPYTQKTQPVVEQGDSYILTASGNTSTGIIHTISSLVAQRGGNFTDFSSRTVGDEFDMVAEVDLPADVALDQLQIDLQHAGADAGLQVRLQHHRLFVATNEITFRRVFA